MAREEITQQNFAGGELSPKMRGRYELPVCRNGCRRLRNNIVETQGQSRFRPGFRIVHYTRRNNVANLIDFQFNDEQAYILEFTDKKLRFFKDEGIIVEGDLAITAMTNANPGVITSAGHGLNNGDEVFIDGLVGPTGINGKTFIVTNKTANTIDLYDIDGNAFSTLTSGAYVSGGTINRIYEISTPYEEALDLFKLKVTQNADTMYIVHPFYEPRKLTRSGHASWSLSLFSRTNDPFLAKKNISGITLASPGVITSAGHGYTGGETVIIEGIVGTVQLNSRAYTVVYIDANTFSLKDYATQVAVDTSGYTAWSSAGYVSKQELLPTCATFHEGRLFYAGMYGNPDQFIGSRSPDTTGNPRYDDFTSGTDADHAVYFAIADGEVNKIFWLIGTNRLLMAGTFGTETKITGETIEKAISPSSVNVRAENRLGVADVTPINKENIVIYVQRGGLTVRTFEFDALKDAFQSNDRNLVADHITKSGIKQITWQTGRPDLLWAVRNDGLLIGLTFKSGEDVSGWHPHDTGKSFGDLFLSACTMPRPTAGDQLWVVTERVVNGHTRRFVEFMEDEAEIPEFFEFYTGDANQAADAAKYLKAMQEAQKEYLHLDCALTYDGTSRGVDANATMTPAAISGNTVNFTASAAVFTSADVGREIWKKAVNGVGAGRARITGITSSTVAVCRIISSFDSTAAMAAGKWYITTSRLVNLDHLEGRSISIVTDGGVHPSKTVTGGIVNLDYQASKIHAGLPYVGFLEPMVIEAGGTTGPAQGKRRNVYKAVIKFLNTLGAEFGTDPYRHEDVSFSEMPLNVGGPQTLFSGNKEIHYGDGWDTEKTVFVRQTNPLPCIVQMIELWVETDEE